MSNNKITPKNILKMNKNKNKITLDNLLQKATTDNVSDAMKNLYGSNGVISGIKPINPDSKIVGRVCTVRTNSSDWGTGIKAIYEAKENEILLIECSDTQNAIWGELASLAAKEHGLQATVIYGASRDTKEILELGYDVFSTTYKSNAGYPLNNGEINLELNIDNNTIVSGDYLIGDYDGVVIVPKEKIDEVLEEVNRIKKFEDECCQVILNGEALDQFLDIH